MIEGSTAATPMATASGLRPAASRMQRDTREAALKRRWLAAICLCIGGALAAGAIGVPTARAAAPLNGSAPLISGSAGDGKRLKVSKGAWEGSRPISYAYRWVRCDA